MEYIAQFYECFEALTLFLCGYLGLKIINEVINIYEMFKLKIASNKIAEMFNEAMEEIKQENPIGKHSKED